MHNFFVTKFVHKLCKLCKGSENCANYAYVADGASLRPWRPGALGYVLEHFGTFRERSRSKMLHKEKSEMWTELF